VAPPNNWDGIELLLQRVPDVKTVKNRMHLDLRVHDLDTETNRLRHPGALIPGLSKPADYENNHPENIRQVA
jgi:hypothetical protein